MKAIERLFAGLLFNSRFLTLLAVVASLVGSFVMFYVGYVDLAGLFGLLVRYGGTSLAERSHVHVSIITGVASAIDDFLFALVLLIFALGIYELFISKIEYGERSDFAARIMSVRNLDDLKDRLAKVIFLILIVSYFENALDIDIHTPTDLLVLAVGVALIALGLFLTKSSEKT